MILITRSRADMTKEDMVPLTWHPVRLPDGSFTATLTCANGHEGLIDEHQIDVRGYVSPSVVCTEDGCGWHEYVQLVGWPP